MGASAATLAKDSRGRITRAALDGNRLVRNREVIYNLALKDFTTIGARGTPRRSDEIPQSLLPFEGHEPLRGGDGGVLRGSRRDSRRGSSKPRPITS